MGMRKPNMGLDFTYYLSTYVSRDTVHTQCKFCQ